MQAASPCKKYQDVFFLGFWRYGHFSHHCDGLRQICGHLSPPVLHSHHESLALWSAGSCVLVHQLVILPNPESLDVAAVFLYQLGHSTLLMWTFSGPHTCLLRHTGQLHPAIYGDRISWHCSLPRDPFLLHPNCLLNPENPFS